MLDQTDLAILELLRKNSRRQWKDIGEQVHMTGQAVAARVAALQEEGIIEAFTLQLNAAKLGRPVRAFITLFMHSADHAAFRRFAAQEQRIVQLHRVSGDGCYWLQADLASHGDLDELLEQLLRFGNYRLQLSIGHIK